MVNVLQSKRESSRFQILVEIAAHQPNLRQKEVADSLGVTPQAMEYMGCWRTAGDDRQQDEIQHHQRGVEWLLGSF
jgi:putative transcriptional regulator